jgi:small subunit ribosomal protein S17
MAERNRRKQRVGQVLSSKTDKTIVVQIERTMKHPLYMKVVKSHSKLYAHDENNEAGVGDTVRVMECRRMSKQKCWRLVEVLRRAK